MRFIISVIRLITSVVLFLNMAKSNGIHREEPVCQRFTADIALKNLINLRRHNTVPCPCDVQKIELDHTFRKSNKCYEQWFFIDGVKQTCCYNDNGHLLVGPPDGGYILLEEHAPYISAAYHKCCHSSSWLCQEFYAINPSDNCSLYETPISVTSGGDVHIKTIDGVNYEFNGHGEYVLLKANEFEIQARTEYVTQGNNDSTMFTAFAIYDVTNKEQIELHLNRATDVINVYRNGTKICDTSGNLRQCETPRRYKCSLIVGNKAALLPGCSIGIYFKKVEFYSGEFIDIRFEKGSKELTNSSGLVGNALQGFKFRNGTILSNDSAEQDMFQFGESWTLQNDSESHFYYSITSKNYNFYNGYHTVPRFLETLLGNLKELFKGHSDDDIANYNKTCRTSWDNLLNNRCLLTIARTGNLSLGEAVLSDIEEEHRRLLILNNKPPKFLPTMPDRISVQNHMIYTLNLHDFIEDEEKNELNKLRFNVTTDIPTKEFSLTAGGNFTWKVGTSLRSLDTSLIFYVFDSLNASASQTVKLNYCGCEEIIQCDYNISSENSTDNVKKASCSCPKYHSGDYCEIIIDPCNSTELNCSISCNSSVPQTFASWPCTPCPRGTRDNMRGDTQECLDINECDISYNGDDKCEHMEKCNNTHGSFVCGCRDGFTLNANKHSCDDTNECLNTTLCQADEVCTNLPGKYLCECAATYAKIGNNCTKIEGSTFVGSTQFPIFNSLIIDQKLNNSINSVENRKSFGKTLTERFNASGQCLGVEVVELSIIKQHVFKRSEEGPKQDLHLKVDYIVQWSAYSTAEQIKQALHDSFTNYTSQHARDPSIMPFFDNIISIQMQLPDIVPNADGLCSIANRTECDHESTRCEHIPPFGRYQCKCLSGFTNLTGSRFVCIDEDECNLFVKNHTVDLRCAHGYCTNTVGSWNCSCPPGRKWQSVGISTYPLYRCQGNYSYIGRLQLGLSENKTLEDQIIIIQTVLKQAFQTSSVVDTIQQVYLKDLLVSVNILQVSDGVVGSSKTTATFNLRMGEIVNISGIIDVLNAEFGRGWISSNSSWQISDVHMYNDSENKLCEFTANGSCDVKTTHCQQNGTSTYCKCKHGFEKMNYNDKFCYDVDECTAWKNQNGTYCSGRGNCSNTAGGYTCLCEEGYQVNTTNSTHITCDDVNECSSDAYICGEGTCNNTVGNWSCSCNSSGYIRTNLAKNIYMCKDIDECTNTSYYCGGRCWNSIGSWNCTCPSGYLKHNHSNFNISCEEINECEEFQKNNTREPMCIRGTCINLPGSWNCTCPEDRQWTSFSNGSYRCQGNFTYVGFINLLTLTVQQETMKQLTQTYVNELYQNTTSCEDKTMALRDLLVSVNIRKVTPELLSAGPYKNFTVMFSLQMGEAVSIVNLQSVLDEAYNKSVVFSRNDTSITISSNMYYNESNNILCNLTNFGGCNLDSTVCIQQNGTTQCQCRDGFQKHPGESKFCDDIDECKSSGTCSGYGQCSNEIGSYSCKCFDGYSQNTSDKNNIACEDIDECLSNAENCSGHGQCKNIPGNYNCSCYNGFNVKYVDGKDPVCEDIDECTDSTTCPDNSECQNQPGNYTCLCKTGFEKYNDTICTDFDECSATNPCMNNNTNCTNTFGSYRCQCNSGYTSVNDTYCEDIDECTDGTLCTDNRKCNNYPGGYNCSCRDGYTSSDNTTACQDFDECNQTDTTVCSSHGKCKNIDGGYMCLCNEGYRVNSTDVNNIACEDIDECLNTSYFCGGNCINTDGAWSCECKSGYTKSPKTNKNNIFCTDIDECVQNRKACIGGFCQNTNGSWTCSCGEGKEVKVIDENTKECSGGYQYVVSLEFAALTSTPENIDETNPQLTTYFEMQITEAYRTSFPNRTVKVDILSIKPSIKHFQRAKRAATKDLSNWEVKFVLVFGEPVKQQDIVSAWSNHTEKCLSSKCDPQPFNMILIPKAELIQDPESDLCDYYKNCDGETTDCRYLHHTTVCTCKAGYTPKENTDTKCKVKDDVCKTQVCQHGAKCMQHADSGGFNCSCLKGWTGKYCSIEDKSVQSVPSSNSDTPNTMLIAVGGSLGGIVFMLLITIFVVFKWRGKKIKEAEKIALKNMDNNGFKPFDGSLYDDRYIGDSQHNSLERKSMTSIREPRPNGTPVQSGYRLSSANLYATPHKLPKQAIHGSMVDLTNGHAYHVHDEPRRLSIQDPQRHIASNMGWSYTANNRPLSSNGDILRKHPQPDYDDRPPSPKPDYHGNEPLDASRDSGVGIGYASNGSTSNDYRRPNHLRRTSYDGPNGESRF